MPLEKLVVVALVASVVSTLMSCAAIWPESGERMAKVRDATLWLIFIFVIVAIMNFGWQQVAATPVDAPARHVAIPMAGSERLRISIPPVAPSRNGPSGGSSIPGVPVYSKKNDGKIEDRKIFSNFLSSIFLSQPYLTYLANFHLFSTIASSCSPISAFPKELPCQENCHAPR